MQRNHCGCLKHNNFIFNKKNILFQKNVIRIKKIFNFKNIKKSAFY